MPIYVYDCKKYGERFELLIEMTAKETKVLCSKCQSKEVTKLLSTLNINTKKASNGGSCSAGCYLL